MRETEFFKDLKIEEEDKARAKKSLWSKGIEKHILIKEYLQVWGNDPLRYTQVATTYRYDKRIRNVLYKYIAYLEEFYRAKILDNYFNRESEISWFTPINKSLNKGLSLNESLEDLEFKHLINIIKATSKDFNEECIFVTEHRNKNLYALRILRNAVMHNKFLLLYRGFEVCYVKGVDANKSANLKANILNLINFLPEAVRDKCKQDINACKEERNNSGKTKWDLPKQVIINL